MKKTLSILIVALAVCIAGAANAAPLLVNGDFSAGGAGWAVESGSVSFAGGVATLGSLNGSYEQGTSQISQGFFITPGTDRVDISFNYIFGGTDSSYMSDDEFNALFRQLVWVDVLWWEQQTVWETTLVSRESDERLGSNYNTYTYLVTTHVDLGDLVNENPNARIRFALCEATSDNTNTWIQLDNVSVDDGVNGGSSAVPEPATLLLLGSGLLGAAGLRRRNHK